MKSRWVQLVWPTASKRMPNISAASRSYQLAEGQTPVAVGTEVWRLGSGQVSRTMPGVESEVRV